MRQVLFRVQLGKPFTLGTADRTSGWPEVGFVWVWLVLVGAGLLYELWRSRAAVTRPRVLQGLALWLAAFPIGLILPAAVGHRSFPIFGYGFMVMVGFLVGVLAARRRARLTGIDPELIWDLGLWLMLGGVIGARLFYLLQYHGVVYRQASSLGDYLFATIDLTGGGLVLIGSLVGAGIGFLCFVWRRQLSTLNLADVITPSAFIGVGFGRIGCLLNGCCFGDRCSLPWGIRFPRGSLTFDVLSHQGFIDPGALTTMPLHPTQIYSSIDGFLLALITSLLFTERRWRGEVFAWGCVMYSITRFLIEFLRGDEMGQLGTGLTISQLYSLVIAALGVVLLAWHARRRGLATTDG